MGAPALLAALDAVLRALLEARVLDWREQVTLDLPMEAGHRFEVWLLRNLKLEHLGPDWYRTVDGLDPKRVVTINNVRITWPLQRMALRGGGSMPDPMPLDALRPQDFKAPP